MSLFSPIKDWFFPPYMRKVDSLDELCAVIPVGDLGALCEWVNEFIPYRHDVALDGKYDPLQNYNGADLTIKAGHGDCESKAAVCSEVIKRWKGWTSGHHYFQFINKNMERKAPDVCWFITPQGIKGWIEGGPLYGTDKEMVEYYAVGPGWKIDNIRQVNDIGERV
jgi:hypothetical protein